MITTTILVSGITLAVCSEGSKNSKSKAKTEFRVWQTGTNMSFNYHQYVHLWYRYEPCY